MRRFRWLRARPAIGACVLVLTSCSASTGPDGIPPGGLVVVAVGDIACGTETPAKFSCQHQATAALVHQLAPQGVLVIGDVQYEDGELEDFQQFYAVSWGAFKAITYPVPGNHEYVTPGAEGYYDYFNGAGVDSGRAGSRARGYYTFTLGTWRAIALNSNCAAIGGCGEGSPQERWLRSVLASSTARCTIALWHHPRFTGARARTDAVAPLWKALQEHRADLVLSAHDHNYQRFAPLTWDGRADARNGIRSFVVGTGGKNVYGGNWQEIGIEAHDGSTFGVLRLELAEGGYRWQFRGVPGSTFADSGSAFCR